VRRRIDKSGVKAQGSTLELLLKLSNLNPVEVGGILSVEVKFADIERNTSGVSGQLDRF
jgi:hypothetical protein